MESRGEEGVLTQYYSMSITERIVNYSLPENNSQKESITYRPLAGKSMGCIFYKKSTVSATQLMRNCHLSEVSLLSNGLFFFFFLIPSPNFLLFSINSIPPLFFVGLFYGFVISCLCQTSVLSCSQINPFCW